MKDQLGSYIAGFFKLESAGGILLMLAAVLALICSNTPLQSWYDLLFSTPVGIRVGALEIEKPLLLWINDGLMAVFFFLVGLELKRELLEGELADRRNVILPGVGAVGGMIVPALIYVLLNRGNSVALQGWAIPAVTDIAFALGVLRLLGSRVPVSIKIFLTSLAIFDDVGAIVIIAVFYTANISLTSMIVVLCCLPVLFWFNRRNVESKSLYILVGIVMWVAMLKSGVHATLTGVILAMFIPLRSTSEPDYSPVKSLESDLHGAVTYFILPVFAFANAGVTLQGLGAEQFLHSVPLGIALGLLIGKQIGVFVPCWLCVKLGWASLPRDMNWGGLYGTAILCGIGFTMSLFIGSLAFEETGLSNLFDERLGIILGSVLSGIAGYLVLHYTLREDRT